MTLHQLIIFRTVVERGSFVQAGKVLQISQPAISAQIKALEDELGYTLIRRKPNSRKLELTEAGETAYQVALKVCGNLEELYEGLRYLEPGAGAGPRRLRVVCGLDAGVYVLPTLVLEFRNSFPDTKITIVTVTTTLNLQELLATVRHDAYDLAIVPQDLSTPAPVCDFTFALELVAVANPGLVTTKGAPDWESLPLVLPPRNSILRRNVDVYFKNLRIKPNIILELNHPEGTKRAIKSGLAAAIIHRVAVQEELERGVLSELEPPLPLPTLTYKVVHTRAKPAEHVRAFSRLLRERLGTK